MWLSTGLNAGVLQGPTEKVSDREVFSSAQPMTVRLRGVMTAESRELFLKGGNDLVVVSKFQIGDEPPVERLHFMDNDTELGWHDDFFDDIIFTTRDFTGERLTLRLQVYDVDSLNRNLVESANQLAKKTAGIFPQLAPYAGAVDFAVDPIVTLVDTLDDHDQILDDRITLEVADPEVARKLLQPGLMVCLREPIDGGCELRDDLQVVRSNGSEYDSSYAVIEVLRERLADRDQEITQKAAKLVAELQGKGQSSRTGLFFLRETLEAYNNFQRLERARSLRSQDELSDSEKELLADLESDTDLKPYLTDA
jgi:hypothetical protein